MIVIDGPDHVGKTRLAEALTEKLNEEGLPHIYHHLSKLPDSFHPVRGYLPLIQPDAVYDRFHPSRQAYGKVFDNQRMLDDFEYSILDSRINLIGGIIIFVTANPEWLTENFGDKEEMYDDVHDILDVNTIYAKMVHDRDKQCDYHFRTGCPLEPCTFPSQNVEWMNRIVTDYIERRTTISRIVNG